METLIEFALGGLTPAYVAFSSQFLTSILYPNS